MTASNNNNIRVNNCSMCSPCNFLSSKPCLLCQHLTHNNVLQYFLMIRIRQMVHHLVSKLNLLAIRWAELRDVCIRFSSLTELTAHFLFENSVEICFLHYPFWRRSWIKQFFSHVNSMFDVCQHTLLYVMTLYSIGPTVFTVFGVFIYLVLPAQSCQDFFKIHRHLSEMINLQNTLYILFLSSWLSMINSSNAGDSFHMVCHVFIAVWMCKALISIWFFGYMYLLC